MIGDIARVALGACLLAGACSCSGKLEGLADHELQDKMNACHSEPNPSPGAAIACDNFRRECLRRRTEGRFVC